MVVLTIPENYGLVLFMALNLALFVTLAGFFLGGGGRKKAFTPEVLSKFEDDHTKAFGKDSKVDKQGYPDNGCSRYSKAMPYKQWFEYNKGQRTHQELMDVVTPILVMALVSGLHYPKVTAYLLFVFILAHALSIAFGGDVAKKGELHGLKALSQWLSSFSMIGLVYYSLKGGLIAAQLIGPDAKAF